MGGILHQVCRSGLVRVLDALGFLLRSSHRKCVCRWQPGRNLHRSSQRMAGVLKRGFGAGCRERWNAHHPHSVRDGKHQHALLGCHQADRASAPSREWTCRRGRQRVRRSDLERLDRSHILQGGSWDRYCRHRDRDGLPRCDGGQRNHLHLLGGRRQFVRERCGVKFRHGDPQGSRGPGRTDKSCRSRR